MLTDSFKSLSLGDSPVKETLNRSMSFPDISPRKRITIQQQIHTDLSTSTLYRRVSCEELDVVPGTSLRLTRKVVSEYYINTPIKEPINFVMPVSLPSSSHKTPNRKRRHLTSILKDLKRKKLLSVNDNQECRDQLRSNDTGDNERASHTSVYKYIIFFTPCVLILLFGLFLNQYITYQKVCGVTFQLNKVEYHLKTKVFGQNNSIQKLLVTLKKMYTENNNFQTYVFTGSTGVGKTYTAKLLEELFPWPHNCHHFVMPVNLQKIASDKFLQNPKCGDHLVIVDDLKEGDVQSVIDFSEFLSTIAKEDRKVIAVYIFKFHKQLQESPDKDGFSQGTAVVGSFLKKGINSELIHFQTLQKENVIQCIKVVLARNWIPATEDSINKVLQQVNYEEEGCKRISSKIAVLHDLWIRTP